MYKDSFEKIFDEKSPKCIDRITWLFKATFLKAMLSVPCSCEVDEPVECDPLVQLNPLDLIQKHF